MPENIFNFSPSPGRDPLNRLPGEREASSVSEIAPASSKVTPISAGLPKKESEAPSPAPAPKYNEFGDLIVEQSSAPEVPGADFERDLLAGRVLSMTVDELVQDAAFKPEDALNQIGANRATPEVVQKLTQVYKAKREQPLDVGAVAKEIPGAAGKAVSDIARAVFSDLPDTVGKGAAGVLGVAVNPSDQFAKEQLKEAAATGVGAVEQGTSETLDLLAGANRKVTDYILPPEEERSFWDYTGPGLAANLFKSVKNRNPVGRAGLSDETFQERLFVDAARREQAEDLRQVEGEVAKSLGLNATELAKEGITLDPEQIERLGEIADVTNFVPIAAGAKTAFKVATPAGRTVATATTKEAAETFAKKLTNEVSEAFKKAPAASRATLGAALKSSASAGERFAKTLRRLHPATTGFLGSLATQSISPFAIGAVTRLIGPPAIKGVSRAVGRAGQLIAGDIKPGPILRTVGTAARGGAAGGLSMVPIALGADYEDEIGTLIGAGVGLGGTSAGLARGGQLAAEGAFNRAFAQNPENLTATADAPAYATDPKLDESHAETVEKLKTVASPAANLVNRARAFLRGVAPNTELYVLDSTQYDTRFPDAAGTRGFYDSASDRILLRADFTLPNGDIIPSLAHELSHSLITQVLPPEQRKTLEDAVVKNYGQERIDAFKKQYESDLGRPITEKQAINEILTEHFSAVVNGRNLGQIPSSLKQDIFSNLAGVLHMLGFYPVGVNQTPQTGQASVSELGVRLSPKLTVAIDKAYSDIRLNPEVSDSLKQLSTPAEAVQDNPAPVVTEDPAGVEPSQPTTQVPDITPVNTGTTTPVVETPEVTPANPGAVTPVAETPEATPADTGAATPVAETPASANVPNRGVQEVSPSISEEQRADFEKLAGPMMSANPLRAVQFNYRGLPKLSVITNFRLDRDGNVVADSFSIQNILENADSLVAGAVEQSVPELVPEKYAFDPTTGKITPESKRQMRTDVAAYLSNQANGYAGTGQSFVRPPEFSREIPAENPSYTPVRLDDNVALFINAAMSVAPPKTARVSKSSVTGQPITPTNVRAQQLAEANVQAAEAGTVQDVPIRRPQTPGIRGPESKQTFKGFERDIAELNPLRKELEEAGVPRPRKQVTEVLQFADVSDIQIIDTPYVAPVSDLVSAAFLPGRAIQNPAPFLKEQSEMPIAQWVAASKAHPGGFTQAALELGQNLEPEHYPAVEGYRDTALDAYRQALEDKDIQKAFDEAFRAQFFRETLESSQAHRGATGLSMNTLVKTPKLEDFMPASSRKLNQRADDIARKYVEGRGAQYETVSTYAPVKVDLGVKLADFYEAAQHEPDNPNVRASYDALAKETIDQYRALVAEGIQIEPFKGEGEPYANSAEMIQDVEQNNHLYFLQTEIAFGKEEGGLASTHPLLKDSGIRLGKEKALVNDIFRAVHDYFGHVKDGNQFGPRGEFNAWRSHSAMYSPEAQGALAAETLAQNSWVNFGPKVRNPDGSINTSIPLAERPFGDQKATVVPEYLIEEALTGQANRVSFMPQAPRIEEFQSVETLPEVLSRPGWAIFTAMQENIGDATNPENLRQNAKLKKELEAAGFSPLEVEGVYNGIPQGTSFIITGISDREALEWGRRYNQESVLTSEGLLYADGTVNPVNESASVFGPDAENSPFYSQVQDGPAFSLGIDFSTRVPVLEPTKDSQNRVFMPSRGQVSSLPVQHSAGAALKNAVGDVVIPAVHYSSRDTKTISPDKFGTGKANPRDLRGEPKSFWFVAGSPLGGDAIFFGNAGLITYGAVVNGKRIYDLTRGKPDPLSWNTEINRAKADEKVQQAGYIGIRIDTGRGDGRKVLLMFEPVKVKEIEDSGGERKAATLPK